MRWLVRVVGLAIGLYFVAGLGILWAMLQPPEVFGQVMMRLPAPVVWGAYPAPRMWMWARSGHLQQGDEAPDFTLSTYDRTASVRLSSYHGDRPVVLVFGSYT
jgi:hypothetical protein